MRDDRGTEEVLIVNPYDPATSAGEGAKLMQFHYAQPPGYGYYAAADPYGYYAEPHEYAQYEPVSGYAEAPGYGYYAAGDPYGYYAEPPEPGSWAEPGMYGVPGYSQYEPVSGYAEPPEFAQYEPVGYYADEYPFGYYADVPEMVGWDGYTPMGYYGEPPFDGYVRDGRPTFNPGCPMPTNVAGFGDTDSLEGYVRPSTVNATCEQFTAQPGSAASVPETFKPLW